MSYPLSQFLLKTIVLVARQNPNVFSSSIRLFSKTSKYVKTNSFVVSYLTNTLDFRPEIALSTSKLVKFDSPSKPDKVVENLKSYGFNLIQISKLVEAYPDVLLSDTEITVFPKLEFLKSKGLSDLEMGKVFWSPGIFRSSLSDQIIPSYDKLRSYFHCDKRTLNTVKRYPEILCHDSKDIEANAIVLREHGVPEIKIAQLLEFHARSFVSCPDRFREVVSGIAKMGVHASTADFTAAVRVSLELGKSGWDSKLELFRKCGFSEEEVLKIFCNEPRALSFSEEKIVSAMSVFVEEMNWSPSLIAEYSQVLGLSLKKRIIPRCSVYKALFSKGLVKWYVTPMMLLAIPEKVFLEKFVERFKFFAPEMLELYESKLSL